MNPAQAAPAPPDPADSLRRRVDRTKHYWSQGATIGLVRTCQLDLRIGSRHARHSQELSRGLRL